MKSIESDSNEILRQLLMREQNRQYTYAEAFEIGNALVTFFNALGDEA